MKSLIWSLAMLISIKWNIRIVVLDQSWYKILAAIFAFEYSHFRDISDKNSMKRSGCVGHGGWIEIMWRVWIAVCRKRRSTLNCRRWLQPAIGWREQAGRTVGSFCLRTRRSPRSDGRFPKTLESRGPVVTALLSWMLHAAVWLAPKIRRCSWALTASTNGYDSQTCQYCRATRLSLHVSPKKGALRNLAIKSVNF